MGPRCRQASPGSVEPVAAGGEPGAVRIGDTLALARGAAGVAQDEIVVGCDGGIGIDGRLLFEPAFIGRIAQEHMLQVGQVGLQAIDLGQVLFIDDHCAAAGMAHHVQMAVAGVARIERHPHQVRDGGAQEDVGRFQPVVFQHRDPVLRPQPQRQQAVGETDATLPRLCEGEPAAAGDDRLALRIVAGSAAHLRADIHGVPPD